MRPYRWTKRLEVPYAEDDDLVRQRDDLGFERGRGAQQIAEVVK